MIRWMWLQRAVEIPLMLVDLLGKTLWIVYFLFAFCLPVSLSFLSKNPVIICAVFLPSLSLCVTFFSFIFKALSLRYNGSCAVYKRSSLFSKDNVNQFGLAGKQRDLGLNPLWLSFLFKSYDLWTLSCNFDPHNYETLKWLSSLPTLMQQSFRWWHCSDRYIISLPPHLHSPLLPNKPDSFVEVQNE